MRAYKYRIYPTPEQATYLRRSMGCVRFVYNWALDRKIKSFEASKANGDKKPKSVSVFDISKELTIKKKEEGFLWLADAPSVSLIWALNNLDTAFKNFFRNIKKGAAGFPKFKARGFRNTMQFHQGYSVDFEKSIINIPKCPGVQAVFHRRFEGDLKTATVSNEPSGGFYVSILIDNQNEKPIELKKTSNVCGIDHGIRNFLTLSDGKVWPSMLMDKAENKRVARASRKLSKKQKGSKNKDRARIKLAKVYEKFTDRRDGYHSKVCTELLRYAEDNNYDTLVFRDYNIKKMMKKPDAIPEGNGKFSPNGAKMKSKLSKKIGDVAWGKFVLVVKNNARKVAINIVEINGAFTSQTCNKCNYKHEDNVKNYVRFMCGSCGHEEDSDFNAAKNTRDEFLIPVL